jgi:hypothetical protein
MELPSDDSANLGFWDYSVFFCTDKNKKSGLFNKSLILREN